MLNSAAKAEQGGVCLTGRVLGYYTVRLGARRGVENIVLQGKMGLFFVVLEFHCEFSPTSQFPAYPSVIPSSLWDTIGAQQFSADSSACKTGRRLHGARKREKVLRLPLCSVLPRGPSVSPWGVGHTV